jgi:hypothetical protein
MQTDEAGASFAFGSDCARKPVRMRSPRPPQDGRSEPIFFCDPGFAASTRSALTLLPVARRGRAFVLQAPTVNRYNFVERLAVAQIYRAIAAGYARKTFGTFRKTTIQPFRAYTR